MKKKYLAIIPARGGSKRLKNKNILKLAGEPLISYSIKVATSITCIDKVIVSTDDQTIAEISKKYGAECPFVRPSALATDSSTTFDVIKHSIQFLEKFHDLYFENIILLQPTSPLRTKEDLTKAIKVFEDKKANAVISVCLCDHSPLWSNTLNHEKSMNHFLSKKLLNKRSQDLPKFYRLNGAIYIYNTKKLLGEGTMFPTEKSFAYEMNRINSVDIDDEVDFKFAEFLQLARNNKEIKN